MIYYCDSADGIAEDQLHGFFVDWPNPPSPEAHLRLLRQSHAIAIAVDTDTDRVVGFVTAISDGVLAAYIPFLEVLPGYQHLGIGSALMKNLLDQLRDYYMIDLLCDEDVQPFYASLGMEPAAGMVIRNYDRQSGGNAQ